MSYEQLAGLMEAYRSGQVDRQQYARQRQQILDSLDLGARLRPAIDAVPMPQSGGFSPIPGGLPSPAPYQAPALPEIDMTETRMAEPQASSPFDRARMLEALAAQESGGDYSALGVPIEKGTHAGTRAVGRWQIMPRTAEGLIRNNPETFRHLARLDADYDAITQSMLTDQKLQDQMAGALMDELLGQMGQDPRAIAAAWYAGPGRAKKYMAGSIGKDKVRTAAQDFPSIEEYVNSVMEHYARLAQQS